MTLTWLKVVAAVHVGPATHQVIAARVKITYSQLRRHINALPVIGVVINVRQGYLYIDSYGAIDKDWLNHHVYYLL